MTAPAHLVSCRWLLERFQCHKPRCVPCGWSGTLLGCTTGGVVGVVWGLFCVASRTLGVGVCSGVCSGAWTLVRATACVHTRLCFRRAGHRQPRANRCGLHAVASKCVVEGFKPQQVRGAWQRAVATICCARTQMSACMVVCVPARGVRSACLCCGFSESVSACRFLYHHCKVAPRIGCVVCYARCVSDS